MMTVMNIVKKMIKKMPAVYAYCQHIQRRRQIRIINDRKNLTRDEQIKLVEQIYERRIGHPINWNTPRTYTEKMQWTKMFEHDPKKSVLSDKYAVREWIKEKIGEDYLIPLLGAWDNYDEIDFDALPNQFVLKTNNGSGTNLIVRDKTLLNKKRVRRLINDWLDTDFAFYNPFEFQYADIPPKIIAEQFMQCGSVW